ncbi:MAG: Dipeptide transport system permease protein DppB [Labilithrix sp.]|nr:Dipeptide transport system permease protein DppB [Labilithrix sp.]
MIQRLARRLAWAVFVVWATVTLAFVVSHALPSDPARMVAGPQARPQDIARIRKELGLDQSLFVQYTRFMGRLLHVGPSDPAALAKEHATCAAIVGPLHLDLGKSAQQRRPVVTILAERLPRTIVLALAAAFVQVLLGVGAGVLAASRKKTAVDHLAVGASLLGISAPTFVIGLFFQWLFAHRLGLLPLDGWGETFFDHVRSVILPALTLGVFGAAYYTRLVRDEMIGQLAQDYVRTARAKGLSRVAVVLRHALRNAMMPIVTILGVDVGTLVGGAIVTESIFRWPGLGSLSVTAMLDRDGPVIMGCVIVTSIAVVASTIAVDFAYAALDPRVRAER